MSKGHKNRADMPSKIPGNSASGCEKFKIRNINFNYSVYRSSPLFLAADKGEETEEMTKI